MGNISSLGLPKPLEDALFTSFNLQHVRQRNSIPKLDIPSFLGGGGGMMVKGVGLRTICGVGGGGREVKGQPNVGKTLRISSSEHGMSFFTAAIRSEVAAAVHQQLQRANYEGALARITVDSRFV